MRKGRVFFLVLRYFYHVVSRFFVCLHRFHSETIIFSRHKMAIIYICNETVFNCERVANFALPQGCTAEF